MLKLSEACLCQGGLRILNEGANCRDCGDNGYVLIIPEGYFLDISKPNKESLGDLMVKAELPTVYAARGVLPLLRGIPGRHFVSNVFDRATPPWVIENQQRVSGLLPGPLLFPTKIWNQIHQTSEGSISSIVDSANALISAGLIRGVVVNELLAVYDGHLENPRIGKGLTAFPLANLGQGSKSTLLVVTRTQGRRPALLDRNVKSVMELRSRLNNVHVNHLIVGDVLGLDLAEGPQLAHHLASIEGVDNRYDLILESLRVSESDYVWFVDDDDFCNPEVAGKLDALFGFGVGRDAIVLDSQHIHQNQKEPSQTTLHLGKKYKASRIVSSLSAANRTPFCSVIFPVESLREWLGSIQGNVALFEDHLLILLLLSCKKTSPWFVDGIGAYIAIHDGGQSVTSTATTAWGEAESRIIQLSSNQLSFNPQIMTVARLLNGRKKGFWKSWLAVIRSLFTIHPYRSFFAFGIPKRLVSGELSIRAVLRMMKDYEG